MGGGIAGANSSNVDQASVSDTQSMVFQFKIILRYTKPKIWRRIQVPGDYNFEDLSEAILDSMGWDTCMHPHKFEMVNPKNNVKETLRPGSPYEAMLLDDDQAIPEYDTKIADWFVAAGSRALYTYDFGDRWEHQIILEKIFPAIQGMKYPKCIGGKRACPPDDIGGIPGYYEMLEAYRDPNDEMHEESIEWFGEDFDPDHFDPSSVWNDDN